MYVCLFYKSCTLIQIINFITDSPLKMAKQLHPTDSDTDTDETSDEEQWFQMKRPTLLKQLQNIMREYPDDVQILYVSF